MICLFIVRSSSCTVKERTADALSVPYTCSIASAKSEMNCSLCFITVGFRTLYRLIALLRRVLISSYESDGSITISIFLADLQIREKTDFTFSFLAKNR